MAPVIDYPASWTRLTQGFCPLPKHMVPLDYTGRCGVCNVTWSFDINRGMLKVTSRSDTGEAYQEVHWTTIRDWTKGAEDLLVRNRDAALHDAGGEGAPDVVG